MVLIARKKLKKEQRRKDNKKERKSKNKILPPIEKGLIGSMPL
jgi:hypothetical protein